MNHREAFERGHMARETYENEAAALDGSMVVLVGAEQPAKFLTAPKAVLAAGL